MTKKIRYIHINVHHWCAINDVFGLYTNDGFGVDPLGLQGQWGGCTTPMMYNNDVHYGMQSSMGIGQCGIQCDMPYATKKVQFITTYKVQLVAIPNVHGHICIYIEMKTVHGPSTKMVQMKTDRHDQCASSCMMCNGQVLVMGTRIMNNHQREVCNVAQGWAQLVVVDTHKMQLGVHMVLDTCNHVLHNGWGGMTMSVDHKDLIKGLIGMVEGGTANGVAFNKLAMETRTELPGADFRHYNLVDELHEEIAGLPEDELVHYQAVLDSATSPTDLVNNLNDLRRLLT